MNILLDIGMAIGPVLGYVHQYRLIWVQKSVGTFSIDICGILIFANILRLNFYIFNQYEIALFFQSVIMVIAQIFLIHICTKYACNKSQVSLPSTSSQSNQYEKEQKSHKFWRWNQFSTFFFSIVLFTFFTFSTSIVFKQLQVDGYGVLIGLAALLSESVIILPQIIKNYQSKSVKGLSYVLVILNLAGDIFKLVYFLIKSQPFQFVMCGIIQVCLDSFVIIQICFYKSKQIHTIEKQHKSHVVENYNLSDQNKPQTEDNLRIIEMKNLNQFYPQLDVNLKFQEKYGKNNNQEQIPIAFKQKDQQSDQNQTKLNNRSSPKKQTDQPISKIKKSISQNLIFNQIYFKQVNQLTPSKSSQEIQISY